MFGSTRGKHLAGNEMRAMQFFSDMNSKRGVGAVVLVIHAALVKASGRT